MSVGGLVNSKHKPTESEIREALGEKAQFWDELVESISRDYNVKGQLSFGGGKYGWALGFRKGRKPLADLYPGEDKLVVQVVLGKAATEAARDLELGPSVKQIFDNARQLYDGRWMFIPVRSQQDVEDINLLIQAKARSK